MSDFRDFIREAWEAATVLIVFPFVLVFFLFAAILQSVIGVCDWIGSKI